MFSNSNTRTRARARDCQAVRNVDDLECLACPPKYRELKTFWEYYTGKRVAPYPTLFSASLLCCVVSLFWM